LVGIVIIAHSHELASGVRNMALQMCRDQKIVIAVAGGLEDNTLGTSFEKIEQAIGDAYCDEGVLILMDLGSAVMTAQMALETLPPEKQSRIRLSNAPLVEGAIAAVAAAASGKVIDEVQNAAERVLTDIPKIETSYHTRQGVSEDLSTEHISTGPVHSTDIRIINSSGLHARPAMQLVKVASTFRSHITLQNLTRQRASVDAKMPMQVAFGAAAKFGDILRITAVGNDAEQALKRLSELVAKGFGELPSAAESRTLPAVPLSAESDKSEGPPPKRIQGVGVSQGFAVAPAFVYAPSPPVPHPLSSNREIVPEVEIDRLETALEATRAQLKTLQAKIGKRLDERTGWIFEFHCMMLEDTLFIASMEQAIRTNGLRAEDSVRHTFAAWKKKAEKLNDTMQARAADLQDVENRLLHTLSGREEATWSGMTAPAIVVATDLTPSDLARMDKRQVKGIATAAGGATSHAAILARTLGIPAVMGLGSPVLRVAANTRLALDGTNGIVEVDPTDETTKTYQAHAAQLTASNAKLTANAARPAVTRDGTYVPVMANVSDLASANEALRNGADGIGLLRTEFLYLHRTTLPDEESQYRAYHEILETMGHRPVVMRTLDAGGDKHLPFIDAEPELNPSLGVRAIRLCLKRPDLFQTQLRAMLRAGTVGNLKIMFPMITTYEEILKAKAALSAAANTLARDRITHAGAVQVGIMIETPAAALKVEMLAPAIDFLSIGSNDLTQYTLACDRVNYGVTHLFDTWDPAVLHLIRHTIDCAHRAGKHVGMCGEFAGQPDAIPFLLGLGLDELSVSAVRIPEVKHLIRQLDITQCRTEAIKKCRI
jgi:phosphoenolpyruvate-protein phosphotransferase/dihydroxyacetone kinase phosphotransfer subunit